MAFDILLIDGDLLIHKAASATQEVIDWGDDIVTAQCRLEDAKQIIIETVDRWRDRLMCPDADAVIAISGGANFRKDLDPTYKSHRTGTKPIGYAAIRDFVKQQYETIAEHGLEADDLLGMAATKASNKAKVIISEDKDFFQIPGAFYRPLEDKTHFTSLAEANRYHMLQTLIGDRADGYPGCPGIGEVKANRLLNEHEPADWWPAIVAAFEKAGLDEEEAILQARLSRILRYGEFDKATKQPILWSPK